MPRLIRNARLCLAVSALPLSACQKPLDPLECRRLLDRYAEMLVREEEPTATPERVALVLDQARRIAAQDSRFEMAACSTRVPRRSFECAMSAPTVDTIERCLVF
ncbi:MAG TPA: hypothetical protein VF395_12895 [Polyangiaceae bacterium]